MIIYLKAGWIYPRLLRLSPSRFLTSPLAGEVKTLVSGEGYFAC